MSSPAETLDAARSGDATARAAVLAELAPTVRRYAGSLCRNGADADEIAQDALLAIDRALPGFEGRSSITSWAWAITRAACSRRTRRAASRAEAALDGMHTERVDDTPDPEELAQQAELERLVRGVMAMLPAHYRDVIHLRDVRGLTPDDGAAELGIGVEAFKSRLHRARAALRDRVLGIVEPAPGCEDVAFALSRQLEGEFDASACARLSEHLERCERCRQRCDAARDVLAACAAQASARRA
jgi:RNA polymerase sigma-70 factor (ECF subfamily)